MLRSLDADKKHCALQWLAACIVTAIAGMNGVKQLMVFHAPLCIAAAILLVLALHDSGTSDWKTGPAALPPSGAAVCGVACHGGSRRGGVFHQQQRHVAAV